MLSPESIVGIVKRQQAGEIIGPLPAERLDRPHDASCIKASTELTLAFLNDCPTPFVDAQVVQRSISTKARGGDKGVQTAVWPIHRLEKKPDFNGGGTTQIEILMDAYGDIMARCVTVLPDNSVRISLVKVFDEKNLRRPLAKQVLFSLQGFRRTLDQRFLSRTPSLV